MKLKNTPDMRKDKISTIKNISGKIQKSIKAIIGNDDIFLKLGEKIFMKTKEKIEKNDMKYIAEGKE